jgi:hypothetical protein
MVMWVRMRKCEDVRLENLKAIFVTTAIQRIIKIVGVSSTKCVCSFKSSYRNTHHSLVSIPFPLMWRFHQVLLVFGIVFTHDFFVSALLALSSKGFTCMMVEQGQQHLKGPKHEPK